METTKKCSRCRKVQPVEEFYPKHHLTPQWRTAHCKTCMRADARRRYHEKVARLAAEAQAAKNGGCDD